MKYEERQLLLEMAEAVRSLVRERAARDRFREAIEKVEGIQEIERGTWSVPASSAPIVPIASAEGHPFSRGL